MNNLTWKKDTSKYANGEIAMCGKIQVGGLFWNSITPSPKYKVIFRLGTFLKERGADTQEECKELVQDAFNRYLVAMGIHKQVAMHGDLITTLKRLVEFFGNGLESFPEATGLGKAKELIKQAEQK